VEPPAKWAAVVVEFDGVVVEPDAATPTEIPVAATTSEVAEIHRLLRLDSNRRALGVGSGTVSCGGLVGSLSFMMSLLLLGPLCCGRSYKGSRGELRFPLYEDAHFFKIWYRKPASFQKVILKRP